MQDITNPLDYISYTLGQFLHFIYNNLSFRNYGLAIIIFTIFVRLVLLPLTVKQYRSTANMQKLQPQIQELQKRYKNDKEKLNQEMLKLYQENKVNPAGGCLPLLIQMPILFALYYVISQPLRFMMGKTLATIEQLFNLIPAADPFKIATLKDLSVIKYFGDHQDKLADVSNMLSKSELINMNFLGLNLGLIPRWDVFNFMNTPLASQYLGLITLPILAAVTTFISIKVSTPQQTQSADNSGKNTDMQASMQRSMMMIMPFMTLMFGFQFPAGLNVYWIVGSIIQTVQQLYINKYVVNKKEVVSK